jgi:hypothetical protein
MKSLRDSCIEFFQDENIKRDLREIAKPILDTIYDELNIYVWIIFVYNIFLVFIILANLFLLLRLLRYSNKVSYLD